jgi:hypothetical protein
VAHCAIETGRQYSARLGGGEAVRWVTPIRRCGGAMSGAITSGTTR